MAFRSLCFRSLSRGVAALFAVTVFLAPANLTRADHDCSVLGVFDWPGCFSTHGTGATNEDRAGTPASCLPRNATLKINTPSGWTKTIPANAAELTLTYQVRVNPASIETACDTLYPNWRPQGWTVRTIFARKVGNEESGWPKVSKLERADIVDAAWHVGGAVSLPSGLWVMVSQVVQPEVGQLASVIFWIDQEQPVPIVPPKVIDVKPAPQAKILPAPSERPEAKLKARASTKTIQVEKKPAPRKAQTRAVKTPAVAVKPKAAATTAKVKKKPIQLKPGVTTVAPK